MKPVFNILCLSLWLISWSAPCLGNAKNSVIVIIGDGMGSAQLEAASLALYGRKGALHTQKIKYHSLMTTHSHSDEVTDSAAAATAMATGLKTNNGFVGRNQKAHDVPNLFEIARQQGLHTGIISTVAISHATPAGFASHSDHRTQTNQIIDQMLSRSRPNLLFGAATEINENWARFKGYDVVSTWPQLEDWQAKPQQELLLSGQFGKDQIPLYHKRAQSPQLPSLPQMTEKALQLLPQPFLLLIESGMIDWGGHEADFDKVVSEVEALDDTTALIQKWMQTKDNVTVIVTADHETGGLELELNEAGALKGHRWTATRNEGGTLNHTSQEVPIYGFGSYGDRVEGIKDNTELFHLVRSLIAPSKQPK